MKIFPDGYGISCKLKMLDMCRILLDITKEAQRLRMSLFQQRAACMTNDPVRMLMLSVPAGGQIQDQFRVVFRDVVQVVGYTFRTYRDSSCFNSCRMGSTGVGSVMNPEVWNPMEDVDGCLHWQACVYVHSDCPSIPSCVSSFRSGIVQ